MGKILLTGTNGYIGSCLLKEVLKKYKKENVILVLRKGSEPKIKNIPFIEYDGTL